MIDVRNLAVDVGRFQLRGIEFQVPRGAYAVLMGRTGSGKTTLLEALCGLKPVVRGTITLADRDVTKLAPAQRGIGLVPQDGALFRSMTVREHLEFALVLRRWPTVRRQQRVEELATQLGLTSLLHRRPRGLSGGETQRVALGRALSFQPAILCLDEPLSALDDESRQELMEVLKRVQQQTGVTALHITHNRQEADRLADVRLQLTDGRIQTVSPADTVIDKR